MKRQLLFSVTFAAFASMSLVSFAQSKSELKEEIETLKQQNQMLMQMLQNSQMNQNQGYQQGYPQQMYPQQTFSSKKSADGGEEADPVELASMDWSNGIRAYGRAEGFDREDAREQAMMIATGNLSDIMNLWASNFKDRTNQSAQKNTRRDLERLTQSDLTTFSEGDLKGIKPVKVLYYKGGTECAVCVEIDDESATQAILSQAEMNDVKKNAEEFRKFAAEEKEKIRLYKNGRNMTTAQQEQDLQMQEKKDDAAMRVAKMKSEMKMNENQQLYDHELDMKNAENSHQQQMQQQRYEQNAAASKQRQDYNLQQQQQYYNYKLDRNQQNNMYNH